uniref:Prolyl 4-hydroxylase alpha subunit domain-containing protein n=1 Tax=Haptolina ericina TaxID=156174 RepID=A0A7S3AJ90_9EUKA|mmetsp:Transcript_21573/g.48575  ORF Transcript_21573/g.48575 Transcript_21573/m.48575 type:complete len:263 (+) Transcript_21573:149-937(+)
MLLTRLAHYFAQRPTASTSSSTASSTLRTPAAGSGWSEVFLDEEAAARLPASKSIEMGHSILLLPGLATRQECEELRIEASCVAAACSSTVTFLTVQDKIGAVGTGLVDSLLKRAISRVHSRLPELLPSLFGDCLEEPSCLHNHRLNFSEDEPWIIVYGAGGEFLPHVDGQALTVLMPLSDERDGAFAGGGTAFWSQQDLQGPGSLQPPTRILSPTAGTAVVFGGNVTHAGHPVSCGERSVLVASFSPHPQKARMYGAVQGG